VLGPRGDPAVPGTDEAPRGLRLRQNGERTKTRSRRGSRAPPLCLRRETSLAKYADGFARLTDWQTSEPSLSLSKTKYLYACLAPAVHAPRDPIPYHFYGPRARLGNAPHIPAIAHGRCGACERVLAGSGATTSQRRCKLAVRLHYEHRATGARRTGVPDAQHVTWRFPAER
jgi:hypothetical protein